MQGIAGPIGSVFSKVASHLVLDNPANGMQPAPDLNESVEQAKVEWMCARAYFDQVTDPELVDYAIYQVKAAERRYMYLLGQARSNWAHQPGAPQTAVGNEPPQPPFVPNRRHSPGIPPVS